MSTVPSEPCTDCGAAAGEDCVPYCYGSLGAILHAADSGGLTSEFAQDAIDVGPF